MAYVPKHVADVFISYCHDDDFGWVERFKLDLENALVRKLRGRTKPEIFFDAEDLRAGRLLDTDIPACLSATGFFIAIVSRRYNNSTYCRQKELARFLRHQPPEAGRLSRSGRIDQRPFLFPGCSRLSSSVPGASYGRGRASTTTPCAACMSRSFPSSTSCTPSRR